MLLKLVRIGNDESKGINNNKDEDDSDNDDSDNDDD